MTPAHRQDRDQGQEFQTPFSAPWPRTEQGDRFGLWKLLCGPANLLPSFTHFSFLLPFYSRPLNGKIRFSTIHSTASTTDSKRLATFSAICRLEGKKGPRSVFFPNSPCPGGGAYRFPLTPFPPFQSDIGSFAWSAIAGRSKGHALDVVILRHGSRKTLLVTIPADPGLGVHITQSGHARCRCHPR